MGDVGGAVYPLIRKRRQGTCLGGLGLPRDPGRGVPEGQNYHEQRSFLIWQWAKAHPETPGLDLKIVARRGLLRLGEALGP